MRMRLHPTAAFLLALTAKPIAAQSASIGGMVVSARTTQPLPNAAITVTETGLRVTTDASGRFRIQGLPQQEIQLVVRAVGYGPWRGLAHPGDSTLRVALTELAVELQQ